MKDKPLHIIIPGVLPGLNEYVRANRANPHTGSQMSRQAHALCRTGMIRYNGRQVKRARIVFRWVEKNKRRDKDNVAFAKKFILDALQETGILKNDGWEEVASFTDEFAVNRKYPHVEVLIYEEGGNNDSNQQ